jgi:hypothetical protein
MLGTTRGNDFDGTIARTRTRTRTRTRKGGGYVDDYDFDATVDDDARFGGGVQRLGGRVIGKEFVFAFIINNKTKIEKKKHLLLLLLGTTKRSKIGREIASVSSRRHRKLLT